MMDIKTTGNFITKLRKDKGLTQQAFAKQLNVTHQAVSKWENGIALPDTETLINIADIFGIKVDDILNVKNNNKYDIKFEFGFGIVPYLDTKKEESLLHKIGNLRTRLNLKSGKDRNVIFP